MFRYQPVNQSINQSINQLTNQPTNQSINQSIYIYIYICAHIHSADCGQGRSCVFRDVLMVGLIDKQTFCLPWNFCGWTETWDHSFVEFGLGASIHADSAVLSAQALLLSETSGGRRDLACLLAWAAVVLSQPDPCLPLLLEDKRAVVILLYAYGRTTTKPAPSLAAHTTTMNKEAPRLLPVEPRLAGRAVVC